jgi:pSer/pThr/pTyr-binding forkhead associated (FHA) protein
MGRSAYCTLVIDDASVSRVHASLRRLGDRFELTDLGSKNGTFVNGTRLGKEPAAVGPSDRIEVGDVVVSIDIVLVSPKRRADTAANIPAYVPVEYTDTTGVMRGPGGRDGR